MDKLTPPSGDEEFKSATTYGNLAEVTPPIEKTTTPEQTVPTPKIVYEPNVDSKINIDTEATSEIMRQLDIPPQDIEKTTIYVDDDYLSVNGSAYPNRLGRLRFRKIPEVSSSDGSIVRIGTIKRGKPRTEESMNRTLVHELEHVAQITRKDKRLKAGHSTIWGLGILGALAGKLASDRSSSFLTKALSVITGAILGQQIGYKIAPHERQARSRAKAIDTRAIKLD